MPRRRVVSYRPLADAREVMTRARAAGPRALVGLSGGKDSLACLALAVEAFGAPNVAAMHMAIVADLRCAEGFARSVAARYGVPVRTYLHPQAHDWYRRGVFTGEPPRGGPVIKYAQVEAEALADSGADIVILGNREQDSVRRRLQLRKWGDVDLEHGPRAYPLARWREEQVYGYLRVEKLPLPPRLGERRMTGVELTPEGMLALWQSYPDDFEKVALAFPAAHALLLRGRMGDTVVA